jgi:hypothetical protein
MRPIATAAAGRRLGRDVGAAPGLTPPAAPALDETLPGTDLCPVLRSPFIDPDTLVNDEIIEYDNL